MISIENFRIFGFSDFRFSKNFNWNQVTFFDFSIFRFSIFSILLRISMKIFCFFAFRFFSQIFSIFSIFFHLQHKSNFLNFQYFFDRIEVLESSWHLVSTKMEVFVDQSKKKIQKSKTAYFFSHLLGFADIGCRTLRNLSEGELLTLLNWRNRERYSGATQFRTFLGTASVGHRVL